MKKSYFLMAAAAAMMLTACTSENDILESGPAKQAVPQEVGFDVYTPAATNVTRAGYAGVMNTDKLKTNTTDNKIGFGVFAFYQNDGNVYASGSYKPNFMYNEHVTWDGGWAYSPLKYWPNETTSDMLNASGHASSTATDMLSFFAYAPYVTTGAAPLSTHTDTWYSGGTTGIMAIADETNQTDPRVEWKVSADPDNNVDLLWGVAPEGLNYTAVNGNNIKTTAGLPILNMVKPDKDQKIKFLFEHALSRIGLTVVSAIDQVADGGSMDANTKVLIDEVIIYGDFGTQGVLNLNNTVAHQANWTGVTRTASTEGSPLFTINGTNGYLAPSLRYVASQISAVATNVVNFAAVNEGVLTSEQPLMVGGPDLSKKVESATPAYSTGTVLYHKVSNDYVVATVEPATDVNVFVADGNNWKQIAKSGTNKVMDGSKSYYNVTATQQSAGTSVADVKYYTKTGDESTGDAVYTYRITGDGSAAITTADYTIAEGGALAGKAYDSDTYYTGLLPRYFMVIPSEVSPATATTINVKITYHVVTKDAKLTGNVSDVTNAITKTVPVTLKNGKSYNLKLILGMTSVKLDATVKDWEVADETEVYLPKNND